MFGCFYKQFVFTKTFRLLTTMLYIIHILFQKGSAVKNRTALVVPEGSPSRGGDVAVYVFSIN